MKPEDLPYPFPSWDERHVTIKDRVWFVPKLCANYQDFSFPGWSSPELFNNSHPIHVEYCSGNGSWIAYRAKSAPDLNWVAVERKFDRTRKIWSKLKNHQLNNLIAICGEAHCATSNYLPPGSVHAVYINFPDPWPKKRHAKHRLIQQPFLDELHRILAPGGTVTFVTDDPPYSAWTIEQFSTHRGFTSEYPAPYYITEDPSYGPTSYFESLWRSQGKTIHYHRFVKA